MAGMSTHFKRLWTPSFLSLTLDILLVDAKGRRLGGVVLDARSGRAIVVSGLSLGVRRRVDVSVLPSVLDAGANMVYKEVKNETTGTISTAQLME
jgi:hypothetical protein